MNHGPRVVLGLPAYNRPDSLPQAIESLLSQTFGAFELVIVDDANSPETALVAERYMRHDSRVHYDANPLRLGMVENWRRVFERGRHFCPGATYFAWVSDHDVWHSRWLQELVAVLDQNPDVVLAYCRTLRTLEDDARTDPSGFETYGITDRAERIRVAARYMLAGDMIYGLMRADALAAAGVFHRVLTPDRQILLALSLFGQFRQVPEILWYREYARFSIERQRKLLVASGAPLYFSVPWVVQHAVTLWWDFAIRGRGRPLFGRFAGARYAAIQFRSALLRELLSPKSTWRQAALKGVFGRGLLAVLPVARVRARSGDALANDARELEVPGE